MSSPLGLSAPFHNMNNGFAEFAESLQMLEELSPPIFVFSTTNICIVEFNLHFKHFSKILDQGLVNCNSGARLSPSPHPICFPA